MSWKKFELASPELASLGCELLNRNIAYLATLKEDGSPRVNPITPFIGNNMLFMFTEPSSPKIRLLRRDGRYAMHNSVGGEGPLIEFLISGEAVEVSDPAVRAQAVRLAGSPVVLDSYILFEFKVSRVLVVEYDQAENRHVRRWS